HTCKKYLSGTALLGLGGPGKQLLLRKDSSSVYCYSPLTGVDFFFCVNGNYDKLASKAPRHIVYQPGIAYSCRVEADLVGSCIQQGVGILQSADATSNSKGDIDMPCNSSYKVYKGLSALVRGSYIEKYKFVSPLFGICL